MSYVIGTIFINLEGKPNILKDVSTTVNYHYKTISIINQFLIIFIY